MSSLHMLNDEMLIQTYEQAVKLNLQPQFISILELELLNRGILSW